MRVKPVCADGMLNFDGFVIIVLLYFSFDM